MDTNDPSLLWDHCWTIDEEKLTKAWLLSGLRADNSLVDLQGKGELEILGPRILEKKNFFQADWKSLLVSVPFEELLTRIVTNKKESVPEVVNRQLDTSGDTRWRWKVQGEPEILAGKVKRLSNILTKTRMHSRLFYLFGTAFIFP